VKLVPAKVGASPKQLAVLGGLVALALVSYFLNRTPSSPEPASTPAPRAAAVPETAAPKIQAVVRRAPNQNRNRAEDFHPTLKVPEGLDVSKIDPTIKLDLLAKVRNAAMEIGPRGSVFSFSQPPPPPAPKVDPIKVSKLTAPPPAPATPVVDPVKAAEAAKPQAPPIPLKFFGYSSPRGGAKRAFFLDGDDIDVAHENDVIKNRYKVIRIGINSVIVEDLNFKSEQTLKLVEELAG
jgi:hypothetical protein